ncbi:AMP-binding protein [Ihubacter massiliensis]|uniref:AMP-binding protein n=1 Tax=Hominibacterium faecale TaxID=2839743 RepID=A0A9J6QVS5_9FIRM|nr:MULTISPECIES: AMP-binding protein [Eubacteriales Family XIII. Incertae Sedis]MCO7123483.1 AMP-binding protein [Ihubacter massiliensis]MCU7379603.1 AMP-binding protein [Hominibacterium faecale]
MLSKEEYRALKGADLQAAEEIVAQIKASTSPAVKYKESRPIMDIKHMIETSAQLYGDHTAFYQKMEKGGPYKTVSYTEMLDMVNGLGTALIDTGLKGKRIGVIGDNCCQWAISYLAALCGTGIVVPLDKELNPLELKQLIIQAEVSCVIFSGRFQKTFEDMKNSGGTVLKSLINMDADQDQGQVQAWRPLVKEGIRLIAEGDRRFLDAQINKDELSVILFTSGTTGVSKGVMLSHWNLASNLMVSPTVLKVNDWDIFFSVLPIHHTYECTCGFLMPIYKGAAIAYCEGLKYITKNLAEVKPTMFLGVPLIFESMYKKIWKNVRKQGKEKMLKKVLKLNRKTKKIGLDLGNLFLKEIRAVFGGRMRIMICGGAAINPEILEGIQDFGIQALQGYGLTECAPLGALNPDTAPKATSIGVPFPGCSMRIDSPNEEGIGELCIKGPNIMLGYYNMPEATASVIRDGWFHTGDLGYIDEDGYAYITGRKKNVIITKNGKNVYPEELEYYLSNVPFIEESFVFGQDSDDGEDTTIVASVKLDEEELKEKLGKDYSLEEAQKLLWQEVDKINEMTPFFKKIKKIIIRKEDFAKNTAKKIVRYADSNREER